MDAALDGAGGHRLAVSHRDAVAGRAGSLRSWNTLHKRHTRWADDGTYARLHQHLLGEADLHGELDWLVSVDSTIVRAHQHAPGARREDLLTATDTQGAPPNYEDRPAEAR